MELSPKTSRALEACYDAVIMPGRWSAALDDLGHSLGAAGCMICPHDVNDRDYGVVFATDCWKVHDVYVRNQDWLKPTIEPRADPYMRQGHNVVTQTQLFTEEEIRTSRFHNEYQRPAGVHDFVAGMFSTENRDWCLPFHKSGEPFSAGAIAQIAEVARRMARIVSIAEKLTRVTADTEIQTLDRMSKAAILLDRFGGVGAANRQAEALFCAGFCVRHGRLWTASAANLARLDRFIAAIAAAAAGPLGVGAQPRLNSTLSAEFPPPIVLTRDSAPWLLIEAMPVASAALEIFDGHQAILVISDMTHASFKDEGILSRAFGLTVAEARLTVALCEGHDIAAAAASFGITPLTARSQLKAIFGKTGARRQAELVARLAQIRSVRRH